MGGHGPADKGSHPGAGWGDAAAPRNSAWTPFPNLDYPSTGKLLAKMMPDPTPETVTRMMGMMGEGDTIGRYPRLLDVFVAAASDPVAEEASYSEMSAMIKGLGGFRRRFRFAERDLKKVRQPVLLIWGDHDPIGDLKAAALVHGALPNATLELVPTGHAPWWGEPKSTASLIENFLSAQ